jgi:hypothetical protein
MDKTEKQVEEELFYRLEKEIGLLWNNPFLVPRENKPRI